MVEKVNLFKTDDVETNRLFGFDYCFCHSDCKNINCGRNNKSKSYKHMMDYSEGKRIYTASDLSSVCSEYMTDEDVVNETLERR